MPATAANLGAGFNCLGLALELYNTLEISEANSGIGIKISGEGKNDLPKNRSNLSLKAIYKVFAVCGYKPKGLKINMHNRIPVSRGLGSSAAAIVAGAVAANELCAKKLSQDDLMQLCADLEGHPDNIAAAFLGGMAICGYEDDKLIYTNIFMQCGLRAIIAVPQNLMIETKDAVAVLPKRVPLIDTVFNLSRVAFFIKGLMADELEVMGLGMDDRLHQSYRKSLIPGLEDVFKAAKGSGANGVALSGAGPSVIAITNRLPDPIGEAMKRAFAAKGIKAKIMVLDASNKGVKVEK